MRNRIQRLHQEDSGFTLIELLVTVVILGVLAAIVVFSVQNFKDDGVQAACKADMKNVEVASEAYYAKQTVPAYAADIATLVSTKYLREAPPDGTKPGDKYKIGYNSADGSVTGDITGGAVTADCSA
jgi:prepilin-type N-terminal cleavage/methylation domain-containing protein